MKKMIFMLMLIANTAVGAEDSNLVKLSTSGICHSEQSPHYNRTKNFIAFETIEECIEAGGRLPR